MKDKITLERMAIVGILVFIIVIQVRLSMKEKQLSELQQAYNELKYSQDTLSQSNKVFIETVNNTMSNMDSLYLLSKKTNEDEIKHYWDSVYNDIATDPNGKDKLSDWLRKFAKE